MTVVVTSIVLWFTTVLQILRLLQSVSTAKRRDKMGSPVDEDSLVASLHLIPRLLHTVCLRTSSRVSVAALHLLITALGQTRVWHLVGIPIRVVIGHRWSRSSGRHGRYATRSRSRSRLRWNRGNRTRGVSSRTPAVAGRWRCSSLIDADKMHANDVLRGDGAQRRDRGQHGKQILHVRELRRKIKEILASVLRVVDEVLVVEETKESNEAVYATAWSENGCSGGHKNSNERTQDGAESRQTDR